MSDFKLISFTVLNFNILSVVYTLGLSAWIALVSLWSQKAVNPNNAVKKDFSSNPNVPKFPPKRVKKIRC